MSDTNLKNNVLLQKRPSVTHVGKTVSEHFWQLKTVLYAPDICLKPGTWKIRIVSSQPHYAGVELDFSSSTHPSLIFALDPQNRDGKHIYQKTIRLAAECRNLELTFEPLADAKTVLSLELERIGMLALAPAGFRKFLDQIRTPIIFARKLRQFFSRNYSLALTLDDDSGYSQQQAYTKWQQIFESSAEKKRVLEKLANIATGQEDKILAIYLAASECPDALADFLDGLDTDELRRRVHLLVVEADGHEIPPTLRERALAMGAKAITTANKSVPVRLLLDHAAEVGAAAFIFIETRGRFHPLAFASLLLHLHLDPGALAIYGDSDELSPGGRRQNPQFKPQWSLEYALSWNYVGVAVAFRAASKIFPSDAEIHAPRAASFELLLHVAGQGREHVIGHIPRLLFHQTKPDQTSDQFEQYRRAHNMVLKNWLEKCHPGAQAEEFNAPDGTILRRLIYPLAEPLPLVTVLIPSKDQPKLLKNAVSSVLQADYKKIEIIIIDNGSTSTAQKELLNEFAKNERIRILRDPRPFNFSRLINKGRREANGDILVLLNDDIESIESVWLRELVSLSARPDIGCVGALLLYDDKTVQHGGVIMNIHGGAEHAFRHEPADKSGVGYRLKVSHEVSAVTAACLAVKTKLYDAVEGFDENLPVTLNDIDFCLKVHAAGFRNLITPHARLIHYESVSRGMDVTSARLSRLASETALFRRRWGTQMKDAPYYSPHLSRSHADFRMRIGS